MDSIILKSVLKTCPEIERDRAESISSGLDKSLKEKGLLSENDLKFVTVNHLQAEGLNEFQSLRLIDWWKTALHNESNQEPRSSFACTDLVVPVPWNVIWHKDKVAKVNKGELAAALIKEKRRPLASAELLLINEMVAVAKTEYPAAKRDIMENMVKEVVGQYPASFVDKVGNTSLGYKRFMDHAKNQYDNYEIRPCRKRKRDGESSLIVNMPVKAVLGLSKENWHDTELPPGETEESQEEMRIELLEYARRKREKDPSRISLCLENTYHTQRRAVLSQYKGIKDFQSAKKKRRPEEDVPEMSDLINEWPYLFRSTGLILHFNKLYSINFEECVNLYISYNSKELLEYLTSNLPVVGNQTQALVEKAIEKGKDPEYMKLLGLFTLLALKFKEPIKTFILNVEPTTKVEDVSQIKDLPSTPCIIACGQNTFGAKKFYVAMDKYCFMATPYFKDAFLSAYSTFFVFHLDFPKKFGLVCEFIQREILNINSETGSKRAEANGSAPLSAKLVNLQSECEAYHKAIAAAKASLDEQDQDDDFEDENDGESEDE